jgi:hypothetical protein
MTKKKKKKKNRQKNSFIFKKINSKIITVKLVCNNQPWDSKKLAVVKKWPLFKGCSSKFSLSFGKLGIRPVVVDRWSLFRGVNTGLAVLNC